MNPSIQFCKSIGPNTLSMKTSKETREKLLGYEFYEKTLGRPRFVMAPMVDGSDLAYRLLARRYGVELCYTPMIACKEFVESEKIQSKSFQTCAEDRPLIVQFCGRDPEGLLKAATLVQYHCQAIDINLGCPQLCAKKGGYGAYLMLEPQLVYEIVRTLHTHLVVPVTCKIRLYPEREGGIGATIKFAQGLRDHGCQLLTVHGRTREQKGHTQEHANWEAIREIRRHVRSIPIIANGSVATFNDISRALTITECDGVMSASGMLRNPALFSGKCVSPFDMIREYLTLTEVYPTGRRYILNHIYSMLNDYFDLFPQYRPKLHTARSIRQYRELIAQLETHYIHGTVHTSSSLSEISPTSSRNTIQMNGERINEKEATNGTDDDVLVPF